MQIGGADDERARRAQPRHHRRVAFLDPGWIALVPPSADILAPT